VKAGGVDGNLGPQIKLHVINLPETPGKVKNTSISPVGKPRFPFLRTVSTKAPGNESYFLISTSSRF